MSSGDGYNRRFEAILADFERKERCVDDTVFYDHDLEQHWWRTIAFLTKVGQSGIVLNPDKFQFARKDVSFAGFKISEDTVEPLPKYLEAIKSFPTPTSTTDIKSWFGLVNQLSSYAQLRHVMEPFRPFLSPRVAFSWNPDLDRAFQQSKQDIVESIKNGVQIFDLERHTCLRPDWSVKGIGYVLFQKHCQCTRIMPDCCSDGWKVTLAGSRFLSSTESRYAAIEGEALAIVWGLEQTRYFTQGCDKLLVVTDHKPLTKIFGDCTLDEISNT
ncbi:MAG: RNase H-like domain-containing protein [Bacteroidota bacterium]